MLRKELLELPSQIVSTLTKEITTKNKQIDSMRDEQRNEQTARDIQHIIWVKELLLGVPNTLQPSDGKTEDILNLCIYKLDLLDFEKDKTDEQFYLDELRGASPNISHVEQYLQYATTAEGYSDYQKILKLYHEQNAGISLYQKRILINDLLHNISQIHIPDLDAFFLLSEDLISLLKSCTLSGGEIYSCGQRGKEIISNCLECYTETFKIPLILNNFIICCRTLMDMLTIMA